MADRDAIALGAEGPILFPLAIVVVTPGGAASGFTAAAATPLAAMLT